MATVPTDHANPGLNPMLGVFPSLFPTWVIVLSEAIKGESAPFFLLPVNDAIEEILKEGPDRDQVHKIPVGPGAAVFAEVRIFMELYPEMTTEADKMVNHLNLLYTYYR